MARYEFLFFLYIAACDSENWLNGILYQKQNITDRPEKNSGLASYKHLAPSV